jgi:hypothetical protein
VLVCAIASEGATTLPLPSDFWAHSSFLAPTRVFQPNPAHPFQRSSRDGSAVCTIELWSSWRSMIAAVDTKEIVSMVDLISGKAPVPREARDQAICFFGALKSLGRTVAEAATWTIQSCLSMHLPTDDSELANALKAGGCSDQIVRDVRAAQTMSKGLRVG